MKLFLIPVGVIVVTGFAGAGFGQNPDDQATATQPAVVQHGGSLFHQVEAAPPPDVLDGSDQHHSPVAGSSFIAVEESKPKKFKKHDLITITVSELSDSQTTGKADSQKQQAFDLQLQQFLKLGGGGAALPVQLATPQSTLPEIKFAYNNNRQNQADQQRTDQFTAKMQAEIVDVKPNGNLVVEATKRIQQDKELQSFFLTGECRAEDVGPDNSVLSTQIANLTLTKNTTGEVKDGTRSGWFNSILDHINPF